MTQIAIVVRPLKNRLDSTYWDDMTSARLPLRRITSSAGYANRFPGISEVFSIVVHETDGWPSRNKAESWVTAYSGPSTVGPQVAIWGDGTITPLVNYPDMTGHATFVNQWALGVETGHRDDRTGYTLPNPPRSFAWEQLSTDANDLTGRKYFVLRQVADIPSEIIAAWFPTATYNGPKRDAAVPAGMLFNELQYRSWALLARYMAEAFLVPRNIPLLPHVQRSATINDAATFRRIVMADENVDAIKDTLVRELLTIPGGAHTFLATDFTAGQEASFDANYLLAAVPANSDVPGWGFTHNAMMMGTHPGGANTPKLQERCVALNKAWLWFFKVYRGFHGHGFSGNIHQGFTRFDTASSSFTSTTLHDHDCPGPLFDWHRFAREMWDWWWWPFDFDTGHAHTNAPIRDYRAASGTTPLREYFFHETAANVNARIATAGGIHGAASSPTTYQLDADSPVYALANGEIVAARFPRTPANAVDMGFVLVRHDVYHTPDVSGLANLLAPLLGTTPPAATPQPGGRIDYDVEPTTVYSLVMHLLRPADLTFTDISDANPEWLNRLIIRRKECDLAFPPATGAMNATLAGMPAAEFSRPPGGLARPTLTESYQLDQISLSAFLNALEQGDLAISQSRQAYEAASQMPIQMILGDYLGKAGVIRRDGAGILTHGMRVEVFSPALASVDFQAITDQTGWNVVGSPARPALLYQSEWARTPDATTSATLQQIGVDPALVPWWSTVAQSQAWDVSMPAADRLPLNGQVYHYSPATFMAWINDLTWASEWPKYKVMDASGNPVARPAAPRSRWG
ncbi:N-acetylmuramoyl-L-alanine amidase [Ancylobacter sp. 6x-1]|uniref:N-acetylmuramoyl-L-alanine amidase n=1 Tax=Ancylobacter crimeensis TaxID=2579147 RepID=A0ABT0DEE3_9HYPH|nr:N-acetylmuramoyl-L-alanine amidase [Ancylobacter crimeensis]MCK0198122.1 N-acetylmuramoyl-L-alanine amidase [Ancylobacter crimeensis]